MKHLLSLAAILAIGMVSSAAAQPSSSAQTCLSQNKVDGWKVIDDRTLIVNDRLGRKYKLSLARGCHDLQFPMRLGFSADTGFGLSCLQRHGYVFVPANGPNFAQRCLIEDVQPYTAQMQHDDAVTKASSR